MWLIILAICILVTILEMFSRTQFFAKTEGCRNFFLRPVAGLTNWGHVRDFRAGTPLEYMEYLFSFFYVILNITSNLMILSWTSICWSGVHQTPHPQVESMEIFWTMSHKSTKIPNWCAHKCIMKHCQGRIHHWQINNFITICQYPIPSLLSQSESSTKLQHLMSMT